MPLGTCFGSSTAIAMVYEFVIGVKLCCSKRKMDGWIDEECVDDVSAQELEETVAFKSFFNLYTRGVIIYNASIADPLMSLYTTLTILKLPSTTKYLVDCVIFALKPHRLLNDMLTISISDFISTVVAGNITCSSVCLY